MMNGYAIKVNGEFLDLFDEQEITIIEESTLFNDKVIAAAHNIPAILPATPKNLRLLGNHKDLQQIVSDNVTAELYLWGSYYAKGTFNIQNVDDNSLEFQFVEFDSIAEIDKTKLNELDFPVYNISIDNEDSEAPLPAFFDDLEERNADFNDPIPDKDFVAPTVYNPSAVGTLSYQPRDDENIFEYPYQNLYVDRWDFTIYEEDGKKAYPVNGISIFPFVSYVLKKIFERYNLIINQNDLSEGEWHNLIIYSNRVICLYNKLDNLDNTWFYEPTLDSDTTRPYEKEVRVSEFMPDLTINDFLKSLTTTFNLQFVPNRFEKGVNVINKSNVIREESMDLTSKVEVKSKITYFDPSKPSLQYKGVEITTPFRFLGSIPDVLNLPISATDKDAYFAENQGILYIYRETEKKFKPFSYLNLSQLGYLTFDVNTKNKNEFTSQPPAISSLSVLELSFTTRTIPYAKFFMSPKTFFVPRIQEFLSTPVSPYDNNSSGNSITTNIHFLLYRGMVQHPDDGFWYPYASTTTNEAFNLFGPNDRTYSNHLGLVGQGGIYETFHKTWNSIRFSGRLITVDVAPEKDIWYKLFLKKIKIHNQEYVCTKKTIKVNPKEVVSCQMELRQIL